MLPYEPLVDLYLLTSEEWHAKNQVDRCAHVKKRFCRGILDFGTDDHCRDRQIVGIFSFGFNYADFTNRLFLNLYRLLPLSLTTTGFRTSVRDVTQLATRKTTTVFSEEFSFPFCDRRQGGPGGVRGTTTGGK